MQPKRFGGQECGFDALIELGIALGRHSGSVAWLVALMNTGWILASFPEQTQQEVWGQTPDVLIATAFAPTLDVESVTDGYMLSGVWPYCSGVEHAEFTMLGGLAAASGTLDYRIFLLPRGDYHVYDDWRALGLRGTGSATVKVINVFVPYQRSLALKDLREGTGPGLTFNKNQLYKIPFGVVFPLCLASPVVGMALGLLETWTEWMKARRVHSVKRAADYLPLQQRCAESAAEVDCAALLLRRDVAEAMGLARDGVKPTLSQRARSWRDGAYAAQLCVRAVDRVVNASGAAAILDSCSLQRRWRDIHAAVSHVSLRWDEAAERFGRDIFGLEPNNQFFF
jgi:3-hydroxy-9,10-secoandrosta-1,3,5(10)-triene-9,17-dione monooxygenase